MSEPTPNGWSYKALRELADVVSGGTPSRYVEEFWEDGTIPWATPSDITATKTRFLSTTRERIALPGLHACGAKLLPPGSLLMTSRATLGEIRISECEVCTNQGFKSLVPTGTTHNEFLYYQMLNSRERYCAFGIGSTFLEVNKKDTERFEILVPSTRAEQRRIAEILSTVDEAIEQTEALIAKTQQIKAGLMHDLFTRGVTPDGHLRPPREEAPQLYKESPLGWIPKEWASDVAAAYCKNIKVGVVNSATDSYVEAGVPFIRSQNVRANTIERDDMLFITDSFNRVQKKSILNSGDLVIVRTGYPGTAAVVPDDLAGANCFSLVIAQPDRRLIDPYFMARYMNSDPCKRDIARLQFGSAQHNFNIGEMRKLRLRVPEVDEQARMNLRMEAAEDRNQFQEDERSKLAMMKSGLMHDLLTGHVPVAAAAAADV